MAKTPVTDLQYAVFVQATGHPAPYVDVDWVKLMGADLSEADLSEATYNNNRLVLPGRQLEINPV